MSGSSPGGPTLRAVALIGIAMVVALSSFGSPAAPATPSSAPQHGGTAQFATTPTVAPARFLGSSPSVGSSSPPPSPAGRGLFFNTSNLPMGPASNCATLFGYACVNDSYDPSINFSSAPPVGPLRGGPVLGVAFTQITNQTVCVGATGYAETEIGFAYSSNLGATWAAPTYLSLTNCTLAAVLPSAYQPTLTSLSNGTFVLAYIAYNVSNPYAPWFEQDLGGAGGYYTITGAALMLTYSYDGGIHWTPPQVLNESLNPNVLVNCCDLNDTHAFTPQRPWITAIGQTIYLAWTNDTYSAGFDFYCEVALYAYSACYGAGSSQVHLLVSKNGGSTWLPPSNLTTVRPAANRTISVGENPYVLVTPAGTVYVAYVTDFYLAPWATRVATGNYLSSADIEIARSTDNGSTFQYWTAASNLTTADGATGGPFQGGQWGTVIAPQLAWSAQDSQLVLAWSMDLWGVNIQCPTTCPDNDIYQNIFVTNSSDGGATWMPWHIASTALNDTGGSAAYNPALAILPDGQVDIATAFVDLNTSINACAYSLEGYCPLREEFLSSTDNGTTFSDPILISDNITGNPTDDPSGWYDTATVVEGQYFVAWAHKWAAGGIGSYSFWPGACCGYPVAHSEIAVSNLFVGSGLVLYYNETGLPAGYDWGLNVMGNLYQATAPSSITVDGVPPLENLTWNVSIVAGSSYGFRYFSNQSPAAPQAFPSTSTVYENFTEQVLLQLITNPPGTECPLLGNQAYFVVCWNPPQSFYYHFSYDVGPFVGSQWVEYGTPISLNASAANMCFSSPGCDIYTSWLNLSFLSWTGEGLGSTNTTSGRVSITPFGPVNETANFQILGICTNPNLGSFDPQCSLNETLEFHETGLPAGTAWNVTIQNNQGVSATQSSDSPILAFTNGATAGIVNYTIWSVASTTPGEVWSGSASPAAPVELPVDRVVNVTFTLAPASSAVFAVHLQEIGLPNATSTGWSLEFGAQSIGLHAPEGTVTLTGGTAAVDVPDVYQGNSTAYVADVVSVQRYLVGESAPINLTTLPSNLTLDGPSQMTVEFVPAFLVTVTSSSGGNVPVGSFWVPRGVSLPLTATALSGYHFVGWAGAGPGSVSSNQPTISIRPYGPVVEAATFEGNGPSLWTLRLVPTGLVSNASYTLDVGNSSYSGTGSFNVTGLASGNYTVAVPYVYSNQTPQTRYVGSVTGTSLTFTGSGLLAVNANGTLDIAFQVQYEVATSASVGGTVSPFVGLSWVDDGSTVPLTATPSEGYSFVGWSGTGAGALSGTATSISPVAASPWGEFAEFQAIARPPGPTFSLTVTETGLPTGTIWGLLIGDQSATGTTTALTVSGLDGTYNVSVPASTVAAGVRYVASGIPSSPQSVLVNSTLAVTFQEEFWVGVGASTGGSLGVASGWTTAGAPVTLSATAAAGWTFVAWVGAGAGNYSGSSASATFTPSGPVNETASFQPVAAPSTGSSPTIGLTGSIAVFVILVVVGVALVAAFRRRSPPISPQESRSAEPTTDAEEPGTGSG